MQKAILILAATLAAFFVSGGVPDVAEIRGRVVRISDGDTLTILSPATGTTGVPPVASARATGTTGVPPVAQHKIRLYGIDAPESHQAFGQKSKHHLSSLVFGKDVNLEMIRAGLAWQYKRYDKNPAYTAAETEARQSRRGLWPDPNPTPPEQFRHAKRAVREQ